MSMQQFTYVAYNRLGGANSWEVVVFATKADATAWVEAPWDGAAIGRPRIVPKKKVGYWAGRPKPFSGEKLMIVEAPSGASYYGWVFPSTEGIPVWG